MGLRSTRPPFEAILLRDARRLVLGRCIGKGSHSAVFAGTLHQPHGIRRRVAVKVWDGARDDDWRAVRAAAQRAACIRHPNVAETYEFGVLEGRPILVCEVIDGVPLSTLLLSHARRRRRVPLDLALFIGVEVAEALLGAARATDPEGERVAVCHLDLSPREVLLTWSGEVKVTDFGLAAAKTYASGVRDGADIVSRLETVSPEMASGLAGDARSDVFSMGLLLRQMLVGPRFSDGTSAEEALSLARQGYVESQWYHPHLPNELVALMTRALEPEPSDRFADTAPMAFELRRIALSLGVADGRIFLKRALESEREEKTETSVDVQRALPAHSTMVPAPGSETIPELETHEPWSAPAEHRTKRTSRRR